MDAEWNSLVADLVAHGERIVSSGSFVGDRDDVDLWRRKRSTWASQVVNAICNRVDPATLHSFERTVSQPPTVGNLHEDLPVELMRLREGLDLLRSICPNSELGQ
jgi:hypothetical protein